MMFISNIAIQKHLIIMKQLVKNYNINIILCKIKYASRKWNKHSLGIIFWFNVDTVGWILTISYCQHKPVKLGDEHLTA